MAAQILILSQPQDVHAFAVREALARKGKEALVWLTSDFPSLSRESVYYCGTTRKIRVHSPGFDLVDPAFTSVWNRRPSFNLDRSLLHPADVAFAEFECSYFRKALFSLLSPGAFWVNHPEAAVQANRKLLQHEAALEVGFMLPDTLYGNDPVEIRNFLERQGGTIIYKPFTGVSWRDEETFWVSFSSALTAEKLPSEPVLRATPGIYQALVPKAFELRVTVMGRQTLTAKVLSQQTETGRVDWRKSYHELKVEPYVLPSEIEELCIRLLAKLGLVFGCFDLIVTPSGDCVFLEVNEMGQFLFLESRAGLPLLDVFSEFLIAGNSDFKWDEQSRISYSDVSAIAMAQAEASMKGHVLAHESASWEGASKPPKSPI